MNFLGYFEAGDPLYQEWAANTAPVVVQTNLDYYPVAWATPRAGKASGSWRFYVGRQVPASDDLDAGVYIGYQEGMETPTPEAILDQVREWLEADGE